MFPIECAGLLFDLDGVLVDSTPAVARVWTRWALAHGLDPAATVSRAHGRPSISTIRELLPHANLHAENAEIERQEILDVEGVVALPGAVQLLQSLSLRRWAIVTSCTRPLAHVRIGAAGLPVPRQLVTASDIPNGKPDPEPYCQGAASLGFAPAHCIVVEDAPAGIRSGKAAGSRVIAVRTTAPDSELLAAGADWIVGNCASITFELGPIKETLLLNLSF